MFKTNIRIAVRYIIKNWGFTLINVGGLTIGACCLPSATSDMKKDLVSTDGKILDYDFSEESV
jgi:hypothetical protein